MQYFLVVKVNCSLCLEYNQIYLNIQGHQKIRKLQKKAFESEHPMICLLLQVITSYQENTTKQPSES